MRAVAIGMLVALVASACTQPGGGPGTVTPGGLASWRELRPAAIGLSNGRLAVFKVNDTGRLEYQLQDQQVSPADYQLTRWRAPQVLNSGPELAGSPTAILNADNTVSVVARGVDGAMHHIRQSSPDAAVPESSWGSWQAVPALAADVTFAASPTLTEFDGNDRRDLVVVGSDGNFWTTSQVAGDLNVFESWTRRYGAGQNLAGAPGATRRADNGQTEFWFIGSDGRLRVTSSAFGGQFVDYGGAWAGSPVSYLAATTNRLTVAANTPAAGLSVQSFVPTGATTPVLATAQGSPVAATVGSTTFLFAILPDGRVQFAPVDARGQPGQWHVIGQPAASVPQSPVDGGSVYAPGEAAFVASTAAGADRYDLEVREQSADGAPVFTDSGSDPTFVVPGGTLKADATYVWTIRSRNTSTQLTGWTKWFTVQASNVPSPPGQQRPSGNEVVDPYAVINLRASAVQAAKSYRFGVRNATGAEVWSTTVTSSAAAGEPVDAQVPARLLAVGGSYRWTVQAFAGAVPGEVASTDFVTGTGASSSSMLARTITGKGYWQLSSNGDVLPFGDATFGGQPKSYLPAAWSTVGIVARPRHHGAYWVLADSGAVYSHGGAEYFGGANLPGGISQAMFDSGIRAVGMATTPTGNGYWILSSEGGVYAFGDAPYRGRVSYPAGTGEFATAIAQRQDGRGYWILSSKGGIASLPGNDQSDPTPFHGNAIGLVGTQQRAAVALQATVTGNGYWIMSLDGGIVVRGGAAYHQNATGVIGNKTAVGFSVTPRQNGYWIMADDGSVYAMPGGANGAQYYGGGNVTLRSGALQRPGGVGSQPDPDRPNFFRFTPRKPGEVPELRVAAATGLPNPATARYTFQIGTDPSFATEVVDQSDLIAATAWKPKPLALKDGRTYFWRVLVVDSGDSKSATVSSAVGQIKVDKRFGTGEPSPYEAAGPVSVNLATGNVVTAWSSPTINGGGLSMTYNSLAAAETPVPGLPAGWSASWTGDVAALRLVPAAGTVTVTMVDGSHETFARNSGGTGRVWKAEGGSDSSLADRSDGTWTYTTGDGTVYDFDAAGNPVSMTLPTDQRKSSALVHTWADTPVGRRVTQAQDPVSKRTMRLYFQGDGQAGCTAPPAGLGAAPPGMICRVVLMDDRGYDLFYGTEGDHLRQIERIVGSDGTSVRFGWETTNASVLGEHRRLTSVADQLAMDAVAAGLRADDASVRTEISYAADGRVERITRPAPTAGAARQKIELAYGDATQDGTKVTIRRDGDAQPKGYSRFVESNALGQQRIEQDQAGRVTTTGWREEAPGDSPAWVQDPSGLRTGTAYDDRWKPTATWGPAPSTWFDTSSIANQWGAIPRSDRQAATPSTTTAYDQGLQGLALTFFNRPDLAGGAKRRAFGSGPAAFSSGTGGYQGLNQDNWSMRAEGLLVPTVEGAYSFSATADGAIRVYVDDELVVDGWGFTDNGTTQTYQSTAGPKSLKAGQRVRIRVEFKDTAGAANWSVRWVPPGGATTQIPAAQLRPDYGLVTEVVDPDGNVTKTTYADPATGLASSTVQPVGTGRADLVTSTTYEPEPTTDTSPGWRRPLTRTLPSGAASTVTYAYYGDQGGPVGNSCGVAGVNQAGRPKSTTVADPDGAGPAQAIVRWYVYDLSGRTRGLLTTTADVAESALGAQPWVCTTYDGRGRPVAVSYPAYGAGAPRTVSYDYSNPLRTVATDPAGTITSEFDLLGRTTRYRDALGNESTHSYDVAGRSTGYATGGLAVSYGYLSDGLLDTVSIDGKVVADSSYADDGLLVSVAYPSGADRLGNGTTGEFRYDELRRPSGISWKASNGSLLASEDVTRFNSGKLRERWFDGNNLNGSTPDFSYDGAGRLTSARVGTSSFSYAFADSVSCGQAGGAGLNSNRTSKTVDGVTTTYCYDHADRLASSSDSTVGAIMYDSRGNMTSVFGETHTYDIADRHLATIDGATTVEYVRDLTDRIIERRVNGSEVARYGSTGTGDAPAMSTDVATGATQWTFGLPGGASYTYKPASVASSMWNYPNLQGSALAAANQSGNKVGSTITWDPDGNNLTGGTPDNLPGSFDYGWLGQHQRPEEHQAGLSPMIEMGARQYSPILGRFLEVDPIEGGTSNDYAYVDDPVNGTDLSGTIASCRTASGWMPCGGTPVAPGRSSKKIVVSSPTKKVVTGGSGWADSNASRGKLYNPTRAEKAHVALNNYYAAAGVPGYSVVKLTGNNHAESDLTAAVRGARDCLYASTIGMVDPRSGQSGLARAWNAAGWLLGPGSSAVNSTLCVQFATQRPAG